MLTPQELKKIEFDKAMFGGYDMAAVDEVFEQITSDYTALTKENAVLKNKLKVLASTIEEYRSVDEAMRKALVTAQNMANDMVREAHEKSDELIRNASAVANAKVADLAAQIREEEKRLAAMKAETAKFIDTMTAAYKSQAEKITSFRPEVTDEETEAIEDTLSLAAEEINKCVADALENMNEIEKNASIDEIPAAPAPVDLSDDDEDDEEQLEFDTTPAKNVSVFEGSTNRGGDTMDLSDIDFDSLSGTKKDKSSDFEFEELKFGKNYDFDDE